MKEMMLLIASVSRSYSFPADGKRRVLGTFSPTGSVGSLHQSSKLCGTKEIKNNMVPFQGIPATSPRLCLSPHDNISSGSLGF